MTFNGWLQIALYCVVVTLLVKPLGGYITKVFNDERHFLSSVLGGLERGIYRLCGVDETQEQHWMTYAVAMLFFTGAGFATLYVLQRLQAVLPFNPAGQSSSRTEPRLQHLGQLHHQHQLAVLRARNHHELSGSDGGSHGAQLSSPLLPELPSPSRSSAASHGARRRPSAISGSI